MDEFVAFDGAHRIAAGAKSDIVRALRHAEAAGAAGPLLAFELRTGAQVDFDLRGDRPLREESQAETRGAGRPKLGVVAREVTLLPRHWEWLGQQRGGASAAIRRLVDAARKADSGATESAGAKAASYQLLSALAGDFPNFEEAARALFADDFEAFRKLVASWPGDVAAVALGRLGALSAQAAL